jgi:uncharacterized protein
MIQQLFINLPVRDLEASKTFFTSLGFAVNPAFTDATAACIVLSDTFYLMLLTHEMFTMFIGKTVADTTSSQEVINSLQLASKEAVDEFFEKVLVAGGTKANETIDMPGMYQRSFTDLDHHLWEVVWCDPAQMIG